MFTMLSLFILPRVSVNQSNLLHCKNQSGKAGEGRRQAEQLVVEELGR